MEAHCSNEASESPRKVEAPKPGPEACLGSREEDVPGKIEEVLGPANDTVGTEVEEAGVEEEPCAPGAETSVTDVDAVDVVDGVVKATDDVEVAFNRLTSVGYDDCSAIVKAQK